MRQHPKSGGEVFEEVGHPGLGSGQGGRNLQFARECLSWPKVKGVSEQND
jgi:hypothetical protein